MSNEGLGRAGVRAQFLIALLAMFTCGVCDALCAGLAADLQRAYLDGIDRAHSATMIANALGCSFLGFTVMLVVCSLLLDKVGMKAMLLFSGVLFLLASGALVWCGALAQGRDVYYLIVVGMFFGGAAHAAVEGTVNPLMGTLFPQGSTHYMSMLHAYYPAGLITGGVLSVMSNPATRSWQYLFLVIAAIAVIYTLMTFSRQFAGTTSSALGVDFRNQFVELLKRPSFFMWFGIMLFTSTMEIAPREWIDVTLSNVVGMRGILIVVYVAALQFVGRHFAGFFEKRLSVEGLLAVSALLCAAGLFGLGYARSPVSALMAATLWGFGICYVWPVMLSIATDRYPRAGAIGVGFMGIAGSISIYVAMPYLGRIVDAAKLKAAGGPAALATMTAEQVQEISRQAASYSFLLVGAIPAALVIVFAVLWMRRDKRAMPSAAGVYDA